MYILELRWEWPFETRVCSAKSGLLSSMTDTSGSLTMLGRKIHTILEVSREAKLPLLFGESYIGIPINFHEETGIVPF